MAIIEPILGVLGPQLTAYEPARRACQQRTGNRSSNNAPRNTYRTRDGRWVAVSTSAQRIAERVVTLVGRARAGRRAVVRQRPAAGSQHADELDEAVAAWIAERDAATRSSPASRRRRPRSPPSTTCADIARTRSTRRSTPSSRCPTRNSARSPMQNVLFRLSETPGAVSLAGRAARPGHRRGARRAGLRGRARSPRCARRGDRVTPSPSPGCTCPATGPSGSPRPSPPARTWSSSTWRTRSRRPARTRPAPTPPPTCATPCRSASRSHVQGQRPGGQRGRDDLDALAGLPGLDAVRLPKVESAGSWSCDEARRHGRTRCWSPRPGSSTPTPSPPTRPWRASRSASRTWRPSCRSPTRAP